MTRSTPIFFLSLLLFAVGACGGSGEYVFVGGPRAVGLDGIAQVETVEGDNQLVSLRLEHLPPPERMGENLTAYVVWFTADDHPTTRAGVLQYDEDTRAGALTATTPLTRFNILITAEEQGDVPQPSDVVIAERAVLP